MPPTPCGLYHVTALEQETRQVKPVYAVETGEEERACGVPIVAGHFWVMPVGRAHSLIALDIRDPPRPIEVGRLMADTAFRPHWLAQDPGSNRLVVGAENGGENRLLLAQIDSVTGRLWWDKTTLSFRRPNWPHGPTGEAFGHAALFRP